MLKRLTINNYRSCKEVVLDDLGEVTALIGRNSVGKSNVLKAISTLAQFACSSGPDAPAWKELPTQLALSTKLKEEIPVSFNAEVVLPGGLYRYTVSAKGSHFIDIRKDKYKLEESLEYASEGRKKEVVFKRSEEKLIVSARADPLNVGPCVATMTALASLLPASDPLLSITEPLRHFFSKVRYYPLDEPAEMDPRAFIMEEEYRKWTTEYNASGNLGTDVPMQLVHLHQARPEALVELNDRLGKKGLRLIDEVTVSDMTRNVDHKTAIYLYMIYFKISPEAGGEGVSPLPFGKLSQGTRRLVRLLTAMTMRDCSLMLIEHPEDGIHKGLVRKVAGLFTTGPGEGQIILSTHSDTLMNSLEPASIRFVSMEDGSTTVQKLGSEELAAASDYVNSDVGGTLSEFLHSVEG